jgi:hypothetical protein
MRSFSIQPKYGSGALIKLMDFIFSEKKFDYPLPDFILENYATASGFCTTAADAMAAAGLQDDALGKCRLKRFLNRILGLPLKLQNHIFDLFLYLVCSI